MSKGSYEGLPSRCRGLNTNHNHDLKNLFEGEAIVAANKPGPFQEFYTDLLAKGIRPEMARLTLGERLRRSPCIFGKKGYVSTPNI